MALLTAPPREVAPAQLMPAESVPLTPHGDTLLHHAVGRHPLPAPLLQQRATFAPQFVVGSPDLDPFVHHRRSDRAANRWPVALLAGQ
jgi:hypothetical protein